MKLQQAWHLVDFYLGHIRQHIKDLRQKAADPVMISETPIFMACVLEEIDIAEKELAEAFRLSKSANLRLQNLYSHRRKDIHDERSPSMQSL